ncbi:MAG: hypothetical protein E7324_04760 [Clostridiales bacterium]|nr:hypothetical protein [Clostridiales bacterium]
MKKLIALMMTLVMLLSCVPAMAADTQEYTHSDFGFSFTAPANWLIVDKSNYQAYINAYNAGTMTFSGTNAATLSQLAAQIEASNCVVAVDPYANNIVMTGVDLGMALTNELFVAILIPQLKTELSNTMPGIEFTSVGEIVPFGENKFITLSATYEMYGTSISVDQLYLLSGTMMYVVNLTTTPVFGDDAIDSFYASTLEVLSSMKFSKPVSVF